MAAFHDFAVLCERLAGTASRLERTRLIADYFRALSAEDAETASRLLVGRAFAEAQGRRLSLGGRAVWEAVAVLGAGAHEGGWAGVADFGELVRRRMPETPLDGPPLSLDDLRRRFVSIAAAAGSGSRRQRITQLSALLRRARPVEAKYLVKIVVGEMRHGVQEGLVLDAVAMASGVPAREIRRANQALGDLGRLVRLAKTDPALLGRIAVQIFRPIKPMLAQSAADVRSAFVELEGRLALEWKLDGARVQIHKQGREVRIFSRRLQDITRSLPDVAALVAQGAAAAVAIFEGEVIAVDGERPLPFQELMRRFRRVRDIAQVAEQVPVQLYLFDVLYLDDRPLLDLPATARWDTLQAACGSLPCVRHLAPADVAAGEAFFAAAVRAGHEGLMAKALDAPYSPGTRGSGWLKIKQSVTLDLVIVAADWGYGRRHGWLSNYHLAARDPGRGGFLPVGKTFKGPTDAEFRAMTERLLRLREREEHGTVFVRPDVVVEVRFDGIQKSPQYACGLALRFARIVRVRNDKSAAEADTIATLQVLFARGAERPPA